MRIGIVIAVAMVSCAAGLGAGVATSNLGVMVLAAMNPPPPPEPEPEPIDPRIDVTALVKTSSWTPEDRATAALYADPILLAAGINAWTQARGEGNRSLMIRTDGIVARDAAYAVATQFRFQKLVEAGFIEVIVGPMRNGYRWRFSLDNSTRAERALGPVATEDPAPEK